MAISLAQQKFMAFEGLLTWAKAVVTQGHRLSGALNEQMRALAEAQQIGRARNQVDPRRETKQAFEAERHFFCIAAAKFFEYRRWAVELKLIEPGIFAEVDTFEADVKVMRDLNEHAREYFEGPGQRPQDWKANMERFNSDPTGTQGTLIGGRLDSAKLAEVVESLIPSIPNMLPGIYEEIARDQ
jgi:hypothetical protein